MRVRRTWFMGVVVVSNFTLAIAEGERRVIYYQLLLSGILFFDTRSIIYLVRLWTFVLLLLLLLLSIMDTVSLCRYDGYVHINLILS